MKFSSGLPEICLWRFHPVYYSWTTVFQNLSFIFFLPKFAYLLTPLRRAAQCHSSKKLNYAFFEGETMQTLQKWAVLLRHLTSDVTQHPNVMLIHTAPSGSKNMCLLCIIWVAIRCTKWCHAMKPFVFKNWIYLLTLIRAGSERFGSWRGGLFRPPSDFKNYAS